MSDLEARVKLLEAQLAEALQRVASLEQRARGPVGALPGGQVVYDPALLAGGQERSTDPIWEAARQIYESSTSVLRTSWGMLGPREKGPYLDEARSRVIDGDRKSVQS